MPKWKDYVTDDEIQRAVNLYDVTDKEYQNVAVAYMYGKSLQEADETRETLTEDEIADASDFMMTNGLPGKMRLRQFESKVNERRAIEEKNGLSPMQAIIARDRLTDLSRAKNGGYDLESDKGKEAACKLYAKLTQNNLLDVMAEHAGLKFEMVNSDAYTQPHALVAPRYELMEKEQQIERVEDQDFAAAVASIPEDGEQLEK